MNEPFVGQIAGVGFPLLLCLAALLPAGSAAAGAGPAEVVTVDFSVDLGPATYRASGFLHGMSEADPPHQLVAPLKPRLFRDWAPGTDGAFAIYPRVKKLGARAQVVLSDSHGYDRDGYWPGDNGDWSQWDQIVEEQVRGAQQRGGVFEWDIWNEPTVDYFWRRDRAQFFETWRHTVQKIRAMDPRAVIVGPSLGAYDSKYIEDFLVYAKSNNALPDILSWHELDSDAAPGFLMIPDGVADARALLAKHDIKIERLCINEIIGPGMLTRPGAAIRYFAALERARVDGACHACWDDKDGGVSGCDNQSLDGLLTHPDRQPRSTWWAYRAYADVTGRLVEVKPGASVDGVAGHDDAAKQARIALGRVAGPAGTVELQLTSLDKVPFLAGRSKVRVTVQRIPMSGWDALPQPPAAVQQDCPVEGNQAKVELPDFGPDDAYQVTVAAGG